MHIAETYSAGENVPETIMLVFEGEARSGKGTSLSAVQTALTEADLPSQKIDQGLKFRSLTKLALGNGVPLDERTTSQEKLSDFLKDDATHDDMLDLLAVAETAPKDVLDDMLYSDSINANVAFVGRNSDSHTIAIDLLHKQVAAAVDDGRPTVLIDGRAMDKHAKDIAGDKIAQYALGFYFRCDVSIAARRTLGVLRHAKDLSQTEMHQLARTIFQISDRNLQDAQRAVDPMREPDSAMAIDLRNFDTDNADFVKSKTLEALRHGMVSINTSYTQSVEEMTVPVVGLALKALELQRQERNRFIEDESLWQSHSPYQEPGFVSVS